MRRHASQIAALGLLLLASGAAARSLGSISGAGSLAVQRRLQQDTAGSGSWCYWTGYDNGDCSNSVDGCCAPTEAKLAIAAPKSYAASVNIYNTNPCYTIFEATALGKVKQADVDKCWAAGRSGNISTPCVVNYDPVKDVVSCDLLDYRIERVPSCPGSVFHTYINCTLSTKDKCSSSNNCINNFPDYLSYLKPDQKTALAKVMGGADLPKLRDMGSCAVSFQWLTVAGRPGLPDFPNKSFSGKQQEYLSQVFAQEDALTAAGKFDALWGTGCSAAGARNRLRALSKQCDAVNKLPKGATQPEFQYTIAANPDKPTDAKLGYLVSAATLQKCLSTPSCEVQYEYDAGGSVSRAYCFRSNFAEGAYIGSYASDDVEAGIINAVYQACYAQQNRFNISSCATAKPGPVWFAKDEAGTSS